MFSPLPLSLSLSFRHAPRASTPSPTPSLSLSQCHSFSDMVPMVMEMFDSLGPRLHSDPVLLCKLVRLGKAYFKELFPVSDVSRTLTSEHLENVRERERERERERGRERERKVLY